MSVAQLPTRLHLFPVILGLLVVTGCDQGGGDITRSFGPPPPSGPSEIGGDSASDYAGDGDGASPDTSGEQGEGQPGGANLTAGVWDDNRNYDVFTSYVEKTREVPGITTFTDEEHAAAREVFAGDRAPREDLDIAIVLDATGSMGDEIAYLQSELGALAASLSSVAPGADIRWALVMYRDEGDAYLTRTFDFTKNVATLQGNLDEQGADGGGDYPEATHRALKQALDLSWTPGPDVARLAFFITDAPHHTGVAAEVVEAVRETRAKDIHLYPVAASGADELTEATLRRAAQLTGGRYLFLTDDSGIGGEHKEPTIPCYFVTLLTDAMSRMVEIELSGVYQEPTADQVIRTFGDPAEGICTLEDGATVAVF